jgi:hypothetical protein
VELLTTRSREFADLRTLADVSAQRGTERFRVRSVVLARAPASVRFEALSPLGSPLLVATVHEGQISAYDAVNDEVSTGPATAETAAKLLGLPFEPEDLVGILAGRPVPPRDIREANVLPPDADGPSIDLIGAVTILRVWMDDAGLVKKAQVSGGRGDALITFHRSANGTIMGFEVTAGLGLIRSTVRYESPVVNAGVETDRFVFSPPKSAKTRPIR